MFSVVFPILAAALSFRDDSDLVARLKRRDPDAMSELYNRYGRMMYSLILRIVRNDAVAEDLVQETFLRVWNRVHGFDQDRGALGPWVLTVARNRAIDYLRSVQGRDLESPLEAERMENPSLFLNLETDILNIDRMRRLKTAFEKLTPNQRTVIELAYYEGLSQTEMSEHLKQPLGTVKTWVRTALKLLREELEEQQVVA
ncbi:MAG: sigma-70 family RNA polymerase sigma factor [Acidobacteria bacterium]|nr:sigma-70 family RNA polymerase sigma factor [Acidobacteriota bacterium]